MVFLDEAKNLINRSQNIFILPSENLQGDNLGASLSLFHTLKKLNKDVSVSIENIPEKFLFFNDFQTNDSKEFIISVDNAQKEIEQLRYENNKQNLKIYLTLRQGKIQEKDIKLNTVLENPNYTEIKSDKQPDLLIILGAENLERVKSTKRSFQNIYETPILNIDNQPSNENFGDVNLIDMTSSLSEISFKLIKTIDEDKMPKNIATYLLAGIIWSSQNLQNPNTRPKTFETASYLIEKGAEHQEIIRHLYKTKPISNVKLFGKSLEKLKFSTQNKLYSILLEAKDFEESGTTQKDLGFIIEELKTNFRIPYVNTSDLLILWENKNPEHFVKGIFYSSKSDSIGKILEKFEGQSKDTRTLFSMKNTDLLGAKEQILAIL